MKTKLAACIITGIIFGIFKLFYEFAPETMRALLYCTCLGFTVTFASGAKINQFPGYLLSMLTGLLWAAGYVFGEKAFLMTGMPDLPAKVAAFGLVSLCIEMMNSFVLPNTVFRFIPLQFAVIIGVFSQKCDHIPEVFLAILIGAAGAVISKQMYTYAGDGHGSKRLLE